MANLVKIHARFCTKFCHLSQSIIIFDYNIRLCEVKGVIKQNEISPKCSKSRQKLNLKQLKTT